MSGCYQVSVGGRKFGAFSLYEACVKAMVHGGSVWYGPREVARFEPSKGLEILFAAMPSERGNVSEWFELAA